MGLKNIRIISDNIADSASYFPSNEDPLYPIENIITEDKTVVYRSSASTVQLLLTWGSVQTVSSVILGFTSLRNTGTYRVRLYSDAIGSVMILDTGVKSFSEIDSNMHLHVMRAIYFNSTPNVIRMTIDLDDTISGIDHIQIGRLIIGNYWSPKINFDTSYSLEYKNSYSNNRNVAGDLVTKSGVVYKLIQVNIPYMLDSDRNIWYGIQISNGVHKSLFVSLFPEDASSDTEQIYQLYGRLNSLNSISYVQKGIFSTSITLEEI